MAAVPAPTGATSTIPGVGVGDARRRQGSETDSLRGARPAWLSTRNLAIGGGAIVVLIFAIVLATRGGGDDKTSAKNTTTAKLDSKNTANSSATDTATGTDVATTDGTGERAGDQIAKSPSGSGARVNNGQGDDEVAASGSDAAAAAAAATDATTGDTSTETGSAATTAATATTTTKPRSGGRRTSSGGSTLGGKQVVLEYDSQARDTKAAAPGNVGKSDQSAITKARTAYASGNQRLFAGDPDGAIKFYRQALSFYPAYVAGYRGLGLAYAQQGNKTQAVKAFKTYVSSVPNAKDAALIRKRITSLQSH
jgi:hypothetical protein